MSLINPTLDNLRTFFSGKNQKVHQTAKGEGPDHQKEALKIALPLTIKEEHIEETVEILGETESSPSLL